MKSAGLCILVASQISACFHETVETYRAAALHGSWYLPDFLEGIALAKLLHEVLEVVLWHHHYAVLWQRLVELLDLVA